VSGDHFLFYTEAFAGHIDAIQRNALRSWQRVHRMRKSSFSGRCRRRRSLRENWASAMCRRCAGTPTARSNLAGIYDQAQELARHEILCHVNCDICCSTISRGSTARRSHQFDAFLMAGRRWM